MMNEPLIEESALNQILLLPKTKQLSSLARLLVEGKNRNLLTFV